MVFSRLGNLFRHWRLRRKDHSPAMDEGFTLALRGANDGIWD